jgi:hypothetical protein
MLRLRRLDAPGMRAYARELRPRFLVLRIRAEGVNLRWAVPSWAIEEPLRFALRLMPLLPGLARYLPSRAAEPLRRFAAPAGGRRTLELLDEFFSERSRDLIALPPGEPFLSVETDDVHLEIKQATLGVRA